MSEPGRSAPQPLWTLASLPSVVPITSLPPALADPNLKRNAVSLDSALVEDGQERLIERRGALFRLHILEAPGEQTPCVVLPLDRLFDTRAAAAIRLWRGLAGRSPGRDPAELPAARRERLVLALRALDGRIEKASYREIAEALFGSGQIPDRGWKTYDLRDRTVRLARLGFSLMQGGYRRLLLYPFRGRI
jgi:hypothetical protein